MSAFQAWLNTAIAAFGPVLIIWQLGRQTVAARMSARSAESAAVVAATHAKEATLAIEQVIENVAKIEVATNSMKDALVAATAKASHLEGRAEMGAERDAKEKPE